VVAAGTDRHEDRLIDGRIYAIRDESERCRQDLRYGRTLEARPIPCDAPWGQPAFT